MLPLDPYRLTLRSAPQHILDVVTAGVIHGEFDAPSSARMLLGGPDPCEDEVVRAADGRVRVTCTTDLPGVTPAMIDWWFGWHLPASERYRLWHPLAHVASRVKEDRTRLTADDKARYIGNVSYVDEYIGPSLKRLAIAFQPPSAFGLQSAQLPDATAVCAYTSDRLLRGQGGFLVHYVVATEQGAQMRSGFWLGDIRHEFALIDGLIGPLLNTRAVRQLIVPDSMALNLLQHCAEEMAHLARFLPQLYRDAHAAGV